MKRIQILSNGGGTQSTAMIVLVAFGILPKPDAIVIADTGREATSTWEYLVNVTGPFMHQHNLKYHIASAKKYATVDLYRGDKILIPVFHKDGKSPGWCSNEWKKRVIERWCNEYFGKGNKFDMWIGYSMDEMKRAKPILGKWQRKFPLLDLRMTRQESIDVVKSAGLPEPPRSACWMCPNRTKEDWKSLSIHDKKMADEFDSEIKEYDPDISIYNPSKDNNKGTDCESGLCFI